MPARFEWTVANAAEAEVMQAAVSSHEFSAHFHETWSVGRIDSGECRFSVDGTKLAASGGELVVIPPFTVHTGGSRRPGLTYKMLYVGERWFSELSSLVFGDGTVDFPDIVIRDRALSAQLNRALAMGAVPEAERKASLAHALISLLERHGRRSDRNERRLALEAGANPRTVLKAIEDGPSSRSTQIRRFAREFGLPPARYLRNLRGVSAKELIRRGLDLAEVAQRLEFSDQAHLTREFKRIHGITPGEYRRVVGVVSARRS